MGGTVKAIPATEQAWDVTLVLDSHCHCERYQTNSSSLASGRAPAAAACQLGGHTLHIPPLFPRRTEIVTPVHRPVLSPTGLPPLDDDSEEHLPSKPSKQAGSFCTRIATQDLPEPTASKLRQPHLHVWDLTIRGPAA